MMLEYERLLDQIDANGRAAEHLGERHEELVRVVGDYIEAVAHDEFAYESLARAPLVSPEAGTSLEELSDSITRNRGVLGSAIEAAIYHRKESLHAAQLAEESQELLLRDIA